MNWRTEGWGVLALAVTLLLAIADGTGVVDLPLWAVAAPAGVAFAALIASLAWLVLFAEIPGAEPPVRVRWWWVVVGLLVLAVILFALASPETICELVPECEP